MTTAKVRNVQKSHNHLVTPENPENSECASTGKQYHVSQSLAEALIPRFMAVISLMIHYFRYLEMYDLLDPVFSMYLVNENYYR